MLLGSELKLSQITSHGRHQPFPCGLQQLMHRRFTAENNPTAWSQAERYTLKLTDSHQLYFRSQTTKCTQWFSTGFTSGLRFYIGHQIYVSKENTQKCAYIILFLKKFSFLKVDKCCYLHL